LTTRPPEASTTACAAAVSHSIVGAIRGYTSALPSATRQSFSELPLDTSSTRPRGLFSKNCTQTKKNVNSQTITNIDLSENANYLGVSRTYLNGYNGCAVDYELDNINIWQGSDPRDIQGDGEFPESVPEPSSLLLLGTGLAGLALRNSKKKN